MSVHCNTLKIFSPVFHTNWVRNSLERDCLIVLCSWFRAALDLAWLHFDQIFFSTKIQFDLNILTWASVLFVVVFFSFLLGIRKGYTVQKCCDLVGKTNIFFICVFQVFFLGKSFCCVKHESIRSIDSLQVDLRFFSHSSSNDGQKVRRLLAYIQLKLSGKEIKRPSWF